jgi:hypothetical protein
LWWALSWLQLIHRVDTVNFDLVPSNYDDRYSLASLSQFVIINNPQNYELEMKTHNENTMEFIISYDVPTAYIVAYAF